MKANKIKKANVCNKKTAKKKKNNFKLGEKIPEGKKFF